METEAQEYSNLLPEGSMVHRHDSSPVGPSSLLDYVLSAEPKKQKR